jgi:peptidoglycan/LPS O-acetylase OafA/YrhL
MAILFRLLPFAIGIICAVFFAMQARYAEWYPWLLAPAFIIFIGGIITMLRKGRRGWEDTRLVVPSLLALLSAGFGMLLLEGSLRYWGIPIFVGVVSYFIVELLFLSTFFASKYPVNGMTHMNLALVPVIFWLAAYTMSGLLVFVNTHRALPIALFTAAGGVLWYVTAHPEASGESRRRWMLIGAWMGMQIGMLIAIVPLRMEVHAMIAALCGAIALRVRRYGIAPPIPRPTIIFEVIVGAVLLIAVASTAAWR